MADETNHSINDPTPEHPAQHPVPQAPIKEGAASAGVTVMPAELGMDDTTSTASAAQTIKDEAAKFARQATDKARDYVAEGKNRAGGALDEVSRLMGDAANTVDEKIGAQYGQYARTAADGIAGFSESLKAKEVEDLIADASAFVRKSPAVAIGIAAALGFVVARLVKAGLDGADKVADGDSSTSPSATPAAPPSGNA